MTHDAFLSAREIAERIRSRESTAVEWLDYFRTRVERFNPRLNAIVVFNWDQAYARAREADRMLARGATVGPLHGVPMTIKESFDVAGLPTTWGDPLLKDDTARRDDVLVERLYAAGAVIFGKTNVPFRLMDFQSYNDIYGTTSNPWDVARGPGGSSGGSAAALAAGLTGFEIGSDIGGSIRNPAHYCGVFGHKPTFGVVGADRLAVPRTLVPTDLSVAGPIARSADDLAIAMRFLAAPNRFNAPAWRLELPNHAKPLKDYRVAVWPADEEAPVERRISDRCQSVADRLARLGATVSDRARPDFTSRYAGTLYRKLLNAATDPTNTLTHNEWRLLDNDRARLRLAWQSFFNEWDIVLCPVTATTAFAHDHGEYRGRKLVVDGATVPYFQQLFWAGLATCAYLPSTVFPTGAADDGLPIGLQAIGNAYEDFTTIEFARLVANELGGFTPPRGYSD